LAGQGCGWLQADLAQFLGRQGSAKARSDLLAPVEETLGNEPLLGRSAIAATLEMVFDQAPVEPEIGPAVHVELDEGE
jgi:hypothetical protein